MKIENLMTAPVHYCFEADTLQHAAVLMRDADIGVCPVVDERTRLVGVITDRDICLAALERKARLDQIKVAYAMTPDPVSCTRSDSIEHAEGLMSRHQVRRLPVVDGARHVVGLISLNDLARAQSRRKDWPGLEPDAIARTLGAVCQPSTAVVGLAK